MSPVTFVFPKSTVVAALITILLAPVILPALVNSMSPRILLATLSTITVESSPNTLPLISDSKGTPSSNNPAICAFKSAVCKYPTSSENSDKNCGAPCSDA